MFKQSLSTLLEAKCLAFPGSTGTLWDPWRAEAPTDVPKQSHTSLRGCSHGAIVINGVLSHDVVLQEQAFWVFLLQGIPLSCILPWKGTRKICFSVICLKLFLHISCSTHPLGIKILLDFEAVDNTGCRQAAFYASQEDQQQGQLRGVHSIMSISACSVWDQFCFVIISDATICSLSSSINQDRSCRICSLYQWTEHS